MKAMDTQAVDTKVETNGGVGGDKQNHLGVPGRVILDKEYLTSSDMKQVKSWSSNINMHSNDFQEWSIFPEATSSQGLEQIQSGKLLWKMRSTLRMIFTSWRR